MRLLTPEAPPSKHAKARLPKTSDQVRRRRRNRIRERIQAALDAKAVRNG